MNAHDLTAAAETRRTTHFALAAAAILLAYAALAGCTGARPSLLRDTTRTEHATPTFHR